MPFTNINEGFDYSSEGRGNLLDDSVRHLGERKIPNFRRTLLSTPDAPN